MEKFKARQFTARYNRLMLHVFLAVLLVSALIISMQVASEIKNRNSQLIEQFKTEANAIDNLIVRVIVLLDVMQINAEGFFINPRQGASIYYSGLSLTGPRDYSLDNVPAPYRMADAGNLTGHGDLRALTPELKTEIEMAFSLNGDFKSTLASIPNAAWVYYTSRNNFINIYPWVHSSEFKFSERLHEKEFYASGVPAANPGRKIFWTSIYRDEAGKGTMVTAAKPVYRGQEFLGTLAIDFTLEELGNYAKAFRPGLGELSIVNAAGQLLAHSSLALTEASVFADALPAGVGLDLKGAPCNGLELVSVRQRHQFICHQLKNAPWKLVYLERSQSLLDRIFYSLGAVFVVLLAALGIVVYLTKEVTFRDFIYPAEALVQHISRQGIEEKRPGRLIPEVWIPWFNTISETFRQNRSLINEVKQKNAELTDLNIALERYMPKFILMLSLEPGCGGTTMGSYFSSGLAKNSKDRKTVYIKYPGDARMSARLGYDHTERVHRHVNGFDIWNDFEFGGVPEGAKSSILVTKILNQYANIVMLVSVKDDLDHFIGVHLEPLFHYCKAIVIMAPNSADAGGRVAAAVKSIQRHVRQDQTTVHTILSRAAGDFDLDVKVDFDVPHLADLPPFSCSAFEVPGSAKKAIEEIIDRIERVHQICVYIPTTVEVDLPADSAAYVGRTMKFLGEKFGGATSSQGDCMSDQP